MVKRLWRAVLPFARRCALADGARPPAAEVAREEAGTSAVEPAGLADDALVLRNFFASLHEWCTGCTVCATASAALLLATLSAVFDGRRSRAA